MKKIFPLALLALALTACNSKPEFSVEGTINNADGQSLVLERMDPGMGWIALDSVRIGSDGSFSIAAVAPDMPDLYRLALNGQYIYLPVDSIDNFTLTADASGFESQFDLSGTPQAADLTAFEKEARRVLALQNADSTEAFRKHVYSRYLQNAKGNILSYYILTRRFGDEYLIDYTSPYYNAVATSFATFRPDAPQTKALEARAREGMAERRKQKGQTRVVEAGETAMVEISLPGKDGKQKALSSVIGKGKSVIVVFSALTLGDAPNINKHLNDLYTTGKADIYQVCLDADQFAWNQAAKALPWTVVYDADGTQSRAALHYNVAVIPTFFIYNAQGELTQRTSDINELPRML